MEYLVHIPHVRKGQRLLHILLVGLLYKDLVGSFFQSLLVFVRERSIASFDKIMVEGGIGVLWRTDGHDGEV